jgi:hypothetical protein
MIVIFSPFSAYAQQYQQDYESAYYPSHPGMAEDNQLVKIQKAYCDNVNVNVNDLSQVQRQEQAIGNNVDNDAVDEATLDSQQLTPEEEALNAITGNADPLITAERNILNVCFNDNDNELSGDFTGTQTQIPPAEDECVLCLNANAAFAEIITESLELPGPTVISNSLFEFIIGEDVTTIPELCNLLREQIRAGNIDQTAQHLSEVFYVLEGISPDSPDDVPRFSENVEALVECLLGVDFG